MDVHILSLVIDRAVNFKYKCRRIGPPLMYLKVCGMENQSFAWPYVKCYCLRPLLELRNE
jgi:hypothetical protein